MPQDPKSFIPDDAPPSFVPDQEEPPQELLDQVQNPVVPQEESQPSIFRKGWDTINTPLVRFPGREQMIEGMGGKETWPGYLTDQGLGLVEGMSSPLGVATGGPLAIPGLGRITAGSKLLSGAHKAASGLNVAAGLEDINQGNVGQGLGEIALGGLGLRGAKIKNQLGKEIPILPETVNTPVKPRVRANTDGTFTNLDTGEIINKPLKPNPSISPMFNPRKGKGMTGEIQKMNIDKIDTTPEGSILSTTIIDKKGTPAQEIFNLPRAIQSSWDLSFPFRQGLGLVHKKAWWTSWDEMIKAYGSENAFKASQAAIAERPLFKPTYNSAGKIVREGFAQQMGLDLTDLEGLSNREEQIMSTWAEKLPGVRRSNRAYTAFANQLRADTFEQLVNSAEKLGLDPKNNIELARSMAKFVNSASGRGSIGELERHAELFNGLFFSPRLMASRMNMIKDGLNPQNYIAAAAGNPEAKFKSREALKSVWSLVGAWTAIAGAASLAGAEVNTDPSNADFGKIKIGNTRLDPAGGLQQYLVLAARMVEGQRTSSTTGKDTELGQNFGGPTRNSLAGDFALNKLSPWWSFAAGLGGATKNKPFPVMDRTVRMITPMIVQDMVELAAEDPYLIPFSIPAAVGMGTQSYSGKIDKTPGMFNNIGVGDINFKGGKLF